MAEKKATDVGGLSAVLVGKKVQVTFSEIPGQGAFEDHSGTVTSYDSGVVQMKLDKGRTMVFSVSSCRYITLP